MRSSRNTLYISRPPTLPALQSEPWQHASAPSIIPPLTWPLPQALRPSRLPPEEQEEGEEDDDDEEGEEEDDGEEEGKDADYIPGDTIDTGCDSLESASILLSSGQRSLQLEDEAAAISSLAEACTNFSEELKEGSEQYDELQDKVDYAWNCTYRVRYDEQQDEVDCTDVQPTDHEDCTFDGQPFETHLGGQVIEYDYGQPIGGQLFDGQPFDDQPVDYDHGDEEYGGEESAGYNSY